MTERSGTSQLVEKAARLVYFGLENQRRLGINREFVELVREYESDSDLKEYVQSIADGLNLTLSRVSLDGVYLIPKKMSIFVPRIMDIPVLGREKYKGIMGLILVAIAAYFFPEPNLLFQAGINAVAATPETIHNYIMERVGRLVKEFGDDLLAISDDEPDEATIIAEYNQLQKTSEKHPRSDALYYIKKVFEHLGEQGLVSKEGEGYLPTIRFKYQMEELSLNEYFIGFMSNFTSKNPWKGEKPNAND